LLSDGALTRAALAAALELPNFAMTSVVFMTARLLALTNARSTVPVSSDAHHLFVWDEAYKMVRRKGAA
jgi:hypothetical protein